MSVTATATVTASPSVTTAERSAARSERLATGLGAIGFATVVLATNAVVGSTPSFDASVDEITTFVADKRDQLAFSATTFAIAMPMLVAFACGIAARLRATCRPEDRVIANIGVAGALLLLPFFAAVVVQRIVLTVGVDEQIGNPELVAFGWRLESAAFVLNMACIGVALLGIGTAASRAGLLPSWFRFIAWVGGVAALVGAAIPVAALEGAPILPLGLGGFLCWMVMLLTIGVRQLRSAD